MARREPHRDPRRTDRPTDPLADALGADPEEVRRALRAIRDAGPEDLPPTWALRTATEAFDTPLHVGTTRVRRASITAGDPTHGAYRSDDHISRYRADLNGACPECDRGTIRVNYRATHHMAGAHRVECKRCGAVLVSEEWG